MKKNIAVLTGGYSGEAVISYKTAATIVANLDAELWAPFVIDISKTGWHFTDETGVKISIDKNDFSLTVKGSKIVFDAVLIALHGSPAEDGKILGYFDCLNIPYTCCSAAVSALTFNKRYTIAVAAMGGIHVAKSLLVFKTDDMQAATILAQLKLPVFVKPNNGGSSIGMSKVDAENELMPALQKAFAEDEQVLIEQFVTGREFTIGVYKTAGNIITLPITEVSSHNKFFDFEAKYQGKSTEITPAQIPEQQAEKIRAAAKKIYAIFNCSGVGRIDFIFDETLQAPVMLEINTVPGQTAESLVPQQVKVAGGTLKQFYTMLLNECFN